MNISKEKFIEIIQRIAKHRKEIRMLETVKGTGRKVKPITIEDIEVEVPEVPPELEKENATS